MADTGEQATSGKKRRVVVPSQAEERREESERAVTPPGKQQLKWLPDEPRTPVTRKSVTINDSQELTPRDDVDITEYIRRRGGSEEEAIDLDVLPARAREAPPKFRSDSLPDSSDANEQLRHALEQRQHMLDMRRAELDVLRQPGGDRRMRRLTPWEERLYNDAILSKPPMYDYPSPTFGDQLPVSSLRVLASPAGELEDLVRKWVSFLSLLKRRPHRSA